MPVRPRLPHVFVSDQLFQGLYGMIVVTDEHDERLTELGILPDTVMDVTLSDTTFEDPDGDDLYEVPKIFPFGCVRSHSLPFGSKKSYTSSNTHTENRPEPHSSPLHLHCVPHSDLAF